MSDLELKVRGEPVMSEGGTTELAPTGEARATGETMGEAEAGEPITVDEAEGTTFTR